MLLSITIYYHSKYFVIVYVTMNYCELKLSNDLSLFQYCLQIIVMHLHLVELMRVTRDGHGTNDLTATSGNVMCGRQVTNDLNETSRHI